LTALAGNRQYFASHLYENIANFNYAAEQYPKAAAITRRSMFWRSAWIAASLQRMAQQSLDLAYGLFAI